MVTVSKSKSFSSVDLLLIVVMLLWGLNYTVIKVGLEQVDPFAFNAIRFSLASAILIIISLAKKSRRPSGRMFMNLLALAIIGNVFYQIAFILGIDRSLAGIASLVIASQPVFVMILNLILRIESVDFRGWVGIVLSFVGILLLINIESFGGAMGSSTLSGDVLLVIATIFWSIYTVLAKPVLASVNTLDLTTYTIALGTVFLTVIAIPSLSKLNVGSISWDGWIAIVYTGVLLAFSYVIWNLGIKKIGSTRTSIYYNLTPVIAILFAWQILGEQLLPRQLFGGALVLVGVYLTRFSKR
ncbi:MAG TPA: DMT family transporter [Candidatus Bathyarchaeia archaeon]|nr:DMT family transporter [Candidatus Bathyarchaeia archaeon]